MQRPTLATFIASRGPGINGICSGDLPSISALVNEAQERLIKDPMAPEDGWWGTWAHMRFTVTHGTPYITAPSEVARLILMTVCSRPTRIQNRFYEYLDFGVGIQPSHCRSHACQQLQSYDRELVPTLTDFTSGYSIRVYPKDAADVGKRVLLGVTDTSGATIYSSDGAVRVTGEYLTLALPFVEAGPFGSLTAIQKDTTFDAISVYASDTVTGTETLLASLAPGERSSGYRRYLVNGLPNRCCNDTTGLIQVEAMAKLDYVPVAVSTDFLLIQNIPALIEECQSIRFSGMDTGNATQLSELHHNKALRLLCGELDHMMGRERPAISVTIFGSDRLRRQVV
jgi:hypothetical protein